MQEKKRGRHKENVKRELRVNVSAEYALWINKQKKKKKKNVSTINKIREIKRKMVHTSSFLLFLFSSCRNTMDK
jgi:hypothetical protein